MKCVEYFDWIGLLMDNELEAGQQSALFAHLSSCDTCRSDFDIMFRARLVMRSDEPEYPADLDNRIFANIPTQMTSIALPPRTPLAAKTPLRARSVHIPVPLAAAVAILVLALGVTVGRDFLGRPVQTTESTAAPVIQPAVEVLYAIPGVEVTATAVSADALGPR